MHHRLNERHALRAKLEAGVNINMLAPRRIGKTWTINRLADDLRQKDWQVIEMDVEGVRSASELLSSCVKGSKRKVQYAIASRRISTSGSRMCWAQVG
jgi:hypothetical protein